MPILHRCPLDVSARDVFGARCRSDRRHNHTTPRPRHARPPVWRACASMAPTGTQIARDDVLRSLVLRECARDGDGRRHRTASATSTSPRTACVDGSTVTTSRCAPQSTREARCARQRSRADVRAQEHALASFQLWTCREGCAKEAQNKLLPGIARLRGLRSPHHRRVRQKRSTLRSAVCSLLFARCRKVIPDRDLCGDSRLTVLRLLSPKHDHNSSKSRSFNANVYLRRIFSSAVHSKLFARPIVARAETKSLLWVVDLGRCRTPSQVNI